MVKFKTWAAVGIGIAILVLLILAGNKISVYFDGRAAAEAALLTEIADREDQLQVLKDKLKKVKVINTVKVITKSVPGPIVIKHVPANCKECLGSIELPINAETKYWRATTPDALRESIRVSILPAYDDELVAPCRKSLANATKQMAKMEVYHPIRLNAEVEVGYGMAGIPGEARISLETGKKTVVSIGAGVVSNIYPDGEVMVNPAITLRLERRLLPN